MDLSNAVRLCDTFPASNSLTEKGAGVRRRQRGGQRHLTNSSAASKKSKVFAVGKLKEMSVIYCSSKISFLYTLVKKIWVAYPVFWKLSRLDVVNGLHLKWCQIRDELLLKGLFTLFISFQSHFPLKFLQFVADGYLSQEQTNPKKFFLNGSIVE